MTCAVSVSSRPDTLVSLLGFGAIHHSKKPSEMSIKLLNPVVPSLPSFLLFFFLSVHIILSRASVRHYISAEFMSWSRCLAIFTLSVFLIFLVSLALFLAVEGPGRLHLPSWPPCALCPSSLLGC